MAKKNMKDKMDNSNNEKESGVGSKIITALITLAVIIICLGIFAIMIKLDVGGFGSGVLRPVLKNVPVVNKILPDVSDAELAEEKGYAYKNLSEAITRIKELEKQLEALSDNNTANSDYVKELEEENSKLKVFEDNQKDFEERVLNFEKEVVFNEKAPDIEEYKAYYESIDPENAEELYRQVVQQIQSDKRIVEMGQRYAKMKPEEAAQILEVMTGDIDLVAKILNNMKPAQSSLILGKMTPEFGAKITKKMSILE